MIKKAHELKSGDIFFYDDREQVAIDDYSDEDYLWVTSKHCFIYPGDDKVYGYTSAYLMPIKVEDEVDIVGNLLNEREQRLEEALLELEKAKMRVRKRCTLLPGQYSEWF